MIDYLNAWLPLLLPIAKAVIAFLSIGVASFATCLSMVVAFRLYRCSVIAGTPGNLPGAAWNGLLFALVLDLIVGAALGVEKFLDLFIQGWGGLVGIVLSLFGSWLGYKAITKVSANNQSVDSPEGPK